MTLDEMKAKYGAQWEFFPDLAIGVAAARWTVPSVGEYERGVLPVILAWDLNDLIPQLDEQAARAHKPMDDYWERNRSSAVPRRRAFERRA
ncbi:hypothetical protein [Nonomuraea roseola]|uniref:Uncharacterized protein n=1 Tax=Nonomuraea roseola TaxID=46179 RepID=A0ABV5Q0R6_9ACTN